MPPFLPIESELRKKGLTLIAGIDEAGRGPLAGPVVSAAVILKENCRLPGLDDSKKLSPRKRESLFDLIIKNCLDYSISMVPPQTIDDINILNAVRLANELCIESLQKKPDYVLIDGRDKQSFNLPHSTIIKGDSKVRSIAAASILAKVSRDRLMIHYAKYFDTYGFERHMGYGTREHISSIARFGLCEIHRRSYSVKETSNL